MAIRFNTLSDWNSDPNHYDAQDVFIVTNPASEEEYAKTADGKHKFSDKELPWRTIPGASIVRATGRIQIRRNVADSTVLADGEVAAATSDSTLIFKIGDGVKTWSQLPSIKAYVDDKIADVAQDINDIEALIPEGTTSGNQLTHQAYVDDIHNEITALFPSNTSTSNKLINLQNLINFINTNVKPDITSIKAVIPESASSENKLADQALVDSKIATAISAAYRYKGSVATYQNLPSTGLTVGDVYNVEDTGDNYAWTGTEWDKLAGTVDLSNYATKIYVDGTITTYIAEYNVTPIANIKAAVTAGKAVFCHYVSGATNIFLPLVDSGATSPVDQIVFAGMNDKKTMICVYAYQEYGVTSWRVDSEAIVYQIIQFYTSSSDETYSIDEMTYWADLYENGAVVCAKKGDSSHDIITNYILNHVDFNSGTGAPESFDFYAFTHENGKLIVNRAVCNVSNGYFIESSAAYYNTTQADTLLADKLDKDTSPTTYRTVYVKAADGRSQKSKSLVGYSSAESAMADSVPIRDANGQLGVMKIPTKDYHAASKKYVDSLVAPITPVEQTYNTNAVNVTLENNLIALVNQTGSAISLNLSTMQSTSFGRGAHCVVLWEYTPSGDVTVYDGDGSVFYYGDDCNSTYHTLVPSKTRETHRYIIEIYGFYNARAKVTKIS